MSAQPAAADHELFALAARLAGVQTIDLLKVRQEGESLVVILVTGQKYRFDPARSPASSRTGSTPGRRD